MRSRETDTMETMNTIESSIVTDCLKSVTVDENDGIQGIFVFPPGFAAFEGHFPDQPVLPAVVQLAAVRLLASRQIGHPLIPTGIHRAKFKSIILPEMCMTVKLQLKQSGDAVSLSFTIDTDKSKAAVGEIECRKHNS